MYTCCNVWHTGLQKKIIGICELFKWEEKLKEELLDPQSVELNTY